MVTKEQAVKVLGAETKKEQKKSVTYALKAIGEHLRTLKADELISGEQEAQIQTVLESAGAKYVAKLWK